MDLVHSKEPQPQASHPSADASKNRGLVPRSACSSEVVVGLLLRLNTSWLRDADDGRHTHPGQAGE